MLIIGRKRDQKIVIAENIVITVLEIGRNRVRFGIDAPREIPIQTRQQASSEAEPKPLSDAAALLERSSGKVAAAHGGRG